MIGLLRSELLRATSRRVVRFLTIGVLIGITVAMVIATLNSHRATDADLQRSERQFQRDMQQCLNGEFGIPPRDLENMGYPDLEAFCQDQVRREFYTNATVKGLKLSGLRPVLEGTAPILLMLAVILGATLVGADWSAGSMATLLTWEPRRVRVFVIRAIAIALVVLVVTLLLEVAFVGMWRLGVSLRGTADDAAWFSDATQAVWRTGVLAIVWGLFAYSAAAITRSTAGGVFVMLGELVLIEAVFRGLRPSIERWTLIQNATAYVTDKPYPSGEQGMTTPAEALLTLLAYLVVALVVALAFTQRRDVT